MEDYFEFQNMFFVRNDDGVWISKNWAMKGPTGCAYDRVMDEDWSQKLEKAYNSKLEKEGLSQRQVQKVDKTPSKSEVQPEKIKKESNKIPKSSMKGSFNPFKS